MCTRIDPLTTDDPLTNTSICLRDARTTTKIQALAAWMSVRSHIPYSRVCTTRISTRPSSASTSAKREKPVKWENYAHSHISKSNSDISPPATDSSFSKSSARLSRSTLRLGSWILTFWLPYRKWLKKNGNSSRESRTNNKPTRPHHQPPLNKVNQTLYHLLHQLVRFRAQLPTTCTQWLVTLSVSTTSRN